MTARPPSLSSDGPFTGLFVPEPIRGATSEAAWLQAMLDAEAALAAAEAEAGLIPNEAAEAIAAACEAGGFDPGAIAREGTRDRQPRPAARRRAAGEARRTTPAGFVHRGATSQDVMDTAAMLVASRALGLIQAELDGVAAACAGLADEHRGTVMAGRTLLQQALPTTFGLKAAGWLDSLVGARERLASLSLAVQLGGAAGTLASLGLGRRAGGRAARKAARTRRARAPLAHGAAAGRRPGCRAGSERRRPGEDRARSRPALPDRGRRGCRGLRRRARGLLDPSPEAKPGRLGARDRLRAARARRGRRPASRR